MFQPRSTKDATVYCGIDTTDRPMIPFESVIYKIYQGKGEGSQSWAR